jgi:hypothetical protein
MKRGSSAGWVALALAGCASAPEPIDYQAALMAPCAAAADDKPWLAVVKWADGETYRQVTRFEADGVMAYAREDEGLTDFDNERSAIRGTTLTFDMNNHFADYTGTFDGVRATGTVKNVNGNSGTWTLTRDCAG